jgi:hypothetical protein
MFGRDGRPRATRPPAAFAALAVLDAAATTAAAAWMKQAGGGEAAQSTRRCRVGNVVHVLEKPRQRRRGLLTRRGSPAFA